MLPIFAASSFLAYTGCRLSEARGVTWADIDFNPGILRVRGSKTESADREPSNRNRAIGSNRTF